MKNCYLIVLLCLLDHAGLAQITITQNDMPHPGDSSRLTVAQLNPFLNYSATGPNHNWDFSNLRTNTQRLDSAMALSAAGLVYSLYYLNIPFNPNRASVAFKGAGLAVNPLIPLTNPYGFYYLNGSQYKQVGIGADVLNFPAPIAFQNDDVIYLLPLQFGDTDTSISDWGFGLNGIGYIGYNQMRSNEVDGWGSLITPHGNYPDVLRVKTVRVQRDTVSIDSLNLNFSLDRPLLTEYKWLANGETSPVLQISTQTILGLELITEILFRDDFLRIETGSVPIQACAGSTITVPYTKYGSFNGPGFLNPGNKFRAQLSDANGSFANPIVIGTVTSNVSGSITATIPAALLPGSHYRIRVVSTDPVREGSDNGTDISIEFPVTAAAQALGTLAFCQPGQVDLLADSSAGYSFQWLLNGNPVPGAVQAALTAVQSGTYMVEVSNSCGVQVSNSLTVTANPSPGITVISNPVQLLCPGSVLTLQANVTDAVSLQWQLNGADLPGETNDSLLVTLSGLYTLIAVNSCGTVTSAVITVNAGILPTVVIQAGGTTSFCDGSSVVLTGMTTDVLNYQWYINGSAIPAATDSFYLAGVSGVYSLQAGNDCGGVTSTGITITVYPNPAQPVITAGADTLYSTTAAGYQWLLNGIPIPGATGNYYVVSQNGLYSVRISDANGCSNTSSDWSVLNTGVTDETSLNIRIFPNPMAGQLHIQLPAGFEDAKIRMLDITGRVVISNTIRDDNDFLIPNTSRLSAGYYTLQVMIKGTFYHFPLIKN